MTQYDSIASGYTGKIGPVRQYMVLPSVMKAVGSVQGKSVLDLACGNGLFAHTFYEADAKRVVGVEISQAMINRAPESNVEYVCADVLDLSLNEEFDIATAVFLLNYAPTTNDLTAMTTKAFQHLKSGGRFIGIVPVDDQDLPYHSTHSPFAKYSPEGKTKLGDGDEITYEYSGGNGYKFTFYNWGIDTYDKCLREGGFASVDWKETQFSEEGLKIVGSDYWDRDKMGTPPMLFVAYKP